MKAVNLRELKNRLGGYVQEVRAGEVILVTNRGVVVAELRRPTHDQRALGALEETLERLAREGVLSIGLENAPAAYPPSPFAGRPELADELLSADRS